METFAAREAKNAFGRLLDTAQREPVTIEKKGRPVVVVISKHAYDAMQQQLRELRSLKETEHLLSTEANRERLMQSLEKARQGTVSEQTLDTLLSYED